MSVDTLAQALAVLDSPAGRAARRRARWRGTARILVTGAHPDDEMSAMLAALVWRDGAHVTYACGTRGEGGQNAIGREAGPLLGALRTREMEEAARRLGIDLVWLSDGPGETPMDFGFARSPEATLARWGRAHVVARLVDAIRRVAPDIVWTCFRDVAGQHGHHRAIARVTDEAVALSADPAYAPPGILATPWAVAKLYRPAWSGSGASYDDAEPPPRPSVVYDAGGHDPVTGLAYVQIGEVSRAAHASQGMGVWCDGGASAPYPLRLIGDARPEADLFDGVACDFSALAAEAGTAGGALRAADAVLASLASPDAGMPDARTLRAALAHLDDARAMLSEDAGPRLRRRIDATRDDLAAALDGDLDRSGPDHAPRRSPPAISARILPDALVLRAASQTASREQRFDIQLEISACADAPPSGPLDIALLMPDGWRRQADALAIALAPGETRHVPVTLCVPPAPPEDDAPPLTIGVTVAGIPALRVEGFSHPHVGAGYHAAPAVLRLRRVLCETPPGLRVATCGDGPDRTDAALRRIGLEPAVLAGPDLADADLRRFDTLILGIGALRRLPRREAALARLHDWVRCGGHLLTLHHKPGDGWDPARSAPGRIEIGSPSIRWRVCDPAAPVRILAPGHTLLSWPNPIGAADWQGWRHERCVHVPMRWDTTYVPLLAMADPGEPEISGALLSGVFGGGRHTHVALALHRQYPELVPGALRLLANLVQAARR